MPRTGLMRHVEDPEFICGFAAALAAFHRWHSEPEKIRAIMEAEEYDLAAMKAAGAEPEDLIELTKCLAGPL